MKEKKTVIMKNTTNILLESIDNFIVFGILKT